MADYRSMVKDADFRCQYDVTPRDPEVEAVLSGIEPAREIARQTDAPRMTVSMPAPQFTWLKPLR